MKLYISRDEDSDIIWLWLDPKKGNSKPEQLKGCEMVNFQRRDSMHEIDKYCCYDVEDFKKKFGMTIRQKVCKSVHLPDKLVLDNVDALYGLFFG